MSNAPTPRATKPVGPGAPLVPIALAVSAGILVDRSCEPSLVFFAAAAALGLGAWASIPRLMLPGLLLCCAAFGALHHHEYRDVVRADDISRLATSEPALVRVRGILAEEPTVRRLPKDSLRSVPRPDSARCLLDVAEVEDNDRWRSASGRVRLSVAGELDGLHAADRIQVIGWLSAPRGPSNPGEFDWAAQARDERIRGTLSVRKTADGVIRLEPAPSASVIGWIAAIRGWGQRTLSAYLPPSEAAVADALLLGDGLAMANEEWSVYIRTGVVHVLCISGQHLVALAAFLWLGLRLIGVRPRRGAWIVALVLFAYAIITGGRPPALRSAVQVAAVCGAIVLRRVATPANILALAWLTVLIVKPTDIADAGCLLSFLCVAVLIWGIGPWFAKSAPDPLDRLIAASRPLWLRTTIAVGKWVAASYVVTIALGLAVMPLTGWRYQLVSAVGILIGPPVVALTSAAIVIGFTSLVIASILPAAATPLLWAVGKLLSAENSLVVWADRLPCGHIYVGEIPGWWVIGVYAGLFAVMLMPAVRRHWRLVTLGLGAWLAAGLLPSLLRPRDDALRATFLAVGHGGCTVIETPDGRTVLFDAGTINGPEVTQRIIAPYLWHRGIWHIDDVFISHADLDHFNGLPALFDRFRVGRVLLTPSFSAKPTPGVHAALRAISDAGVTVRIVKAGESFAAGDVVFEVLHPPAAGPEGVENFRSMTVRVRHAGHSLLLTGDLQGAGLDMVLARDAEPVDIMQAPHHGSRTSNTPALATWARPRSVVSCEGPPTWPTNVPRMYADHGARFISTWSHGAVTFLSHKTGLVAETFMTRQEFVVR